MAPPPGGAIFVSVRYQAFDDLQMAVDFAFTQALPPAGHCYSRFVRLWSHNQIGAQERTNPEGEKIVRKSILIAATAVLGSLAMSASAVAAVANPQQKSIVKLKTFTGGSIKGNTYGALDAYLSTREPASTRPLSMAHPVAKVILQFPKGSVLNTDVISAKNKCTQKPNTYPGTLAKKCAAAKIGSGWALLNSGGTPTAMPQLSPYSGAHNCAKESPLITDSRRWTQYQTTYESLLKLPAAANLVEMPCVPLGYVWTKTVAYLGSGDGNTVTKPKDIIFANDNKVVAISFAGSVDTKNAKLTVPLPAGIGGVGSQAGELPTGAVLTDFRLPIVKPNFLKAPACPASGMLRVTSTVSYSYFAIARTNRPKETAADKPATQTINCLLYTSPSPRDRQKSRMPSSA